MAIRSKSSTWFETKVRVARTMDDGLYKKVTEQYTVEAVNWTVAEAEITEAMGSYLVDFEITDIRKAAYGEVFFSEDTSADKYYKCKLAFITIDERTSKEKRSNVCYLVQAGNIDKAKTNIDEAMRGTMIDYEVVSVVETKLLEVFEYHSERKTKPSASVVKAVKNFEKSIPDGQKVTITSDASNNKIVIDKTTKKEIPKNE